MHTVLFLSSSVVLHVYGIAPDSIDDCPGSMHLPYPYMCTCLCTHVHMPVYIALSTAMSTGEVIYPFPMEVPDEGG